MKNIHEVVRQKELDIECLRKEIEALRIVVPMLQDQQTTPTKTHSATRNSKPGSAPANSGTTTEIIWE